MSGYLEINTSPQEIRALGDRIASTGDDLVTLASTASSEHGETVGGEEAMDRFGNDDLGKTFKPQYRGQPEIMSGNFPATNAGQFFASVELLGTELGKLGGGVRAAVDEQMVTEFDSVAQINKIDPTA